jgi:hypothetical protein
LCWAPFATPACRHGLSARCIHDLPLTQSGLEQEDLVYFLRKREPNSTFPDAGVTAMLDR